MYSAAELPARAGRSSRLVRSVGGTGWRTNSAANVFDAEHGELSGLPSGISPGNPTGVLRGPRARVPVFSGCLPSPSIRQLESGEENLARLSARGDRALHRVPLAWPNLSIKVGQSALSRAGGYLPKRGAVLGRAETEITLAPQATGVLYSLATIDCLLITSSRLCSRRRERERGATRFRTVCGQQQSGSTASASVACINSRNGNKLWLQLPRRRLSIRSSSPLGRSAQNMK